VFSKAYVISLSFRKDRLDKFLQQLAEIDFSLLCDNPIEVWPAIHGDTVKHPPTWGAGNGAWGCFRSHFNILEHAYNNNYDSYIVFEDDAIFRPEFNLLAPQILSSLPEDWEQFYLGGQLLHENERPPIKVNEHIYIPPNVNRTHCFAVSKRGYEKLYHYLLKTPDSPQYHIDHHIGTLHDKGGINVYVPNRWLVGQDKGSSNISGQVVQEQNFWYDPEVCSKEHELYRVPICVLLLAPFEVSKELQKRGWHQGHYKTEDGLDRGVCEAISMRYPNEKLKGWYDWIRREVIREGMKFPTLYHPIITDNILKHLDFANFIVVRAETVEEAEAFAKNNEALKSYYE
jgi:GR25 family glycosyltransferase involved in LPS biosynthesis